MCLEAMMDLEQKEGYCLKVMRATNKPGVFLPYWPYFKKDGRGGSFKKEKGCVPVSTVYRLEEPYTVKHRRVAKVDADPFNRHYPALVHAFVSARAYYGSAYTDYQRGILNHDKHHFRGVTGFVVMICRYAGGKHTDGAVLTAKTITPLRPISPRDLSHLHYEESHDHGCGFNEAVKKYLRMNHGIE